jgi:hypothetical protein
MTDWEYQWATESLHRIRDETFGEGKRQVKPGQAPQN